MDTVVQGEGFPLSVMAHPNSWAHDPQAPLPEYDPIQARRILEDAGWRDSNNDGVRECRGCLYAREGDDLRFRMLYDAGNVRHEIAASVLQRMFFSVGAGVTFSSGSLQERYNQTFDAYMTTRVEGFPINPDLTPLFSTQEDQPATGDNAGSYSNPEVDALLEQARNVPGCDREARREIYRQIHAILREDVPAFPLYVLPVMVAAQGEVIGFDPLPGAPLWNIEKWSIQRRE
jgi:peptide/nickel transport system substrate-binding protein